MSNVKDMENFISIGELSRLTGITTHTLRVWEKRYGTPHSERLPSGHRRYPKEEVPRLRAIAKALESGYRASKVVSGTLEELQNLLGVRHLISPKTGEHDLDDTQTSRDMVLEKWIEAAHRYDDQSLNDSLFKQWGKSGPLKFITEFVVPFVERVGKGWESGELTVAQEHFASECLSNFLSSRWRRLNNRVEGPTIVMATLPEETHNLGLLMCAVVASLADCKVLYLGPNTPLQDIIDTTTECKVPMICLSVSKTMNPVEAEDYLFQLRSELKKKVHIVVGGEGTPNNIPGILRMMDFSEFYDWLLDFKEKLPPAPKPN